VDREAGRWREALERGPDGQNAEQLARGLKQPAGGPLAEALRRADPEAAAAAARKLARQLGSEAQRQALRKRLERARKRLERATPPGSKGADAAAARAAAGALEELERALERGDRQAAKAALERMARQFGALKRALKSLQRQGDEESADDERLRRALEKLGAGKGADQALEDFPFADEATALSKKEREELLRDLEEAARQLEKMTPEEKKALEEELKRLSESLASGDAAASGQAARRVSARLVRRIARARSLARALAASRQRLSGNAAGPGRGGSDAGTGHTSRAADPFRIRIDGGDHDRNRVDPTRRPGGLADHVAQNGQRTLADQVKTQPAPVPSQDRGPGPGDEIVAVESIPGPEGAQAPLGKMPPRYVRAAREALRGERIPPGLRRQVGRYFGDDVEGGAGVPGATDE
jgi:hypothetical protein